MKVKDLIKWLETQNQELEVSVIEVGGDYSIDEEGNDTHYTYTDTVVFDDPKLQATITKHSLILGVE